MKIRRQRFGGGAGLLMLLVVIAIIAIIYFARMGDSGKSYVETTLDAREHAKEIVSQANLSAIYKSLQTYAAAYDGKYPPSAKELEYAASLPRDILVETGGTMVYVPGQGENSPPNSVLLYQEQADAKGMHQVLLAGGKIGMLSSPALDKALMATEASIR